MLKTIFTKLSGQSQPDARSSAGISQPKEPIPSSQPIYPSKDSGYLNINVEALIQSNDDLIRRIRLLASCDDEQFEKLYLSPIHNLARFIHLLPATETDHHSGAGGLFRLCLELGFFSGQSAHGKFFHPQESIQVRRVSEPQWRYATFLAGLCAETYRAMCSMVVTSENGSVWQPHAENLLTWLENNKSERYFVTFPSAGHIDHRSAIMSKTMSAYCSHRVLNKSSLTFAFNNNPRLATAFFGTIGGVANTSDNLLLFQIIDDIRTKIIEKDRASQPARYGRPSVASHLEAHLIDAMRTLIATGQWKINQEKAFVWHATDGLFIVWRSAAKSLISHLNKNGVSGVPAHPDTLADLLVKAQFFQRTPDGGCYFDAHIPNTTTTYPVVKVSNRTSLLEHDQAEPLPVAILKPQAKTTSHAPVIDSDTKSPDNVTQATHTPNQPQVDSEQDEITENTDSVTQMHSPEVKTKSQNTNPSSMDLFQPPGSSSSNQPKDPGSNLPLTSTIDVSVDPTLKTILDKHRLLNLVRWLARDFNTSVDTETLFQNEDGVCIAVERISAMGNNPAEVAEALLDMGLLFTPPSKPNLKIHTVPSPKGVKTKVFIVSTSNSKRLGFNAA